MRPSIVPFVALLAAGCASTFLIPANGESRLNGQVDVVAFTVVTMGQRVSEATAKLFVDAAPEVRARRRWLELKGLWRAGDEAPPDAAAILKDIEVRDARDRSRVVAPSRPAQDAALLDTSNLAIDAAFAAALALVSPKIAKALQSALKDRQRG